MTNNGAPDWGKIRKLFPATRDYIYLDGANKGALPTCVAEATQEWLQMVYDDAGIGAFSMDEMAIDRFPCISNIDGLFPVDEEGRSTF